MSPPPDFGVSWSCVQDLTPTFAKVTGRRLLAEAAVRRITTRKGQLIDDPNYGIDVRDWINEGMTPAQLARLGGTVDGELVKDERILSSKTTSSFVNNVLRMTVVIDDGEGPFPLTVAVSQLTVELLTVGE